MVAGVVIVDEDKNVSDEASNFLLTGTFLLS
jgi:hypothetical protein